MQPSTTSLDSAAVEAATAPLRALHPPTRAQLAAAHRRGRDPNELIAEFKERYDAACDETYRIVIEIAGDDQDLYRRLWDEANAIGDARRREWWTAPILHVAKVLNPAVRQRDLARMEHQLRSSIYVGVTVRFKAWPTTSARAPRPGRATVANRARRTVRTAAPTRGDPDDPDPERAWQDLDEWLAERRQALDAFTRDAPLRFDGEVGS